MEQMGNCIYAYAYCFYHSNYSITAITYGIFTNKCFISCNRYKC